MKNLIPLAALAAITTTGALQAQTQAFSTPSGYVTVSISPGIFNLTGVSLHEPVVLSGVIDSATATTIVDADVDFSALAAGTYILELNDDSGIIQEVTVLDANTLTTVDDLSGSVTGGVTAYKLRPASTLDSVFGADNSKANLVESPDGGDSGVDKIIVQSASGLSTYFYVNAPGVLVGWFDGTGAAGDTVLNYADGLYVQTTPTSTATDFVITGQVKEQNTGSVLNPGFNLLNPVVPAGLTLGTSGLQDYILASTDGGDTGVDKVLIPDSETPGAFKTYYYVNAPGVFVGWFDGTDPADDVKLEGAFFLNNVEGSVKPYLINGPTLGS
ncbi:MAG: hypothetical protein ACSHX9_14155 [Luteolibacter sp.]